jgi:hypothetical protein
MREPLSVTLSGRRYLIEPLPAGKALNIASRIVRTVGGAAGGLVSAGRGGGGAIEEALATGLEGMARSLPEEELTQISEVFAKYTRTETSPGSGNLIPMGDSNSPVAFDVLFSGALDEWLEWFSECLKVNFGPLLARARAKADALRAKAPPATA